ncbi:MAG TPA: hypothetical protein P5228_02970 [Bacteroidales bacterium]|nr:hypothetical protein [Bacteroidales bacterium]HRZ49250.1 hypothetical protein [Bacteroidales bacterium]
MKYKAIISSLLVLAMMGTSCSLMKTGSVSSPTYTSGKSFGSSLIGLYGQYKKDGKVDMTNPVNLGNLVTLAAACAVVKGQPVTSPLYKDFASGVVAGSGGMVQTGIVDQVIASATKMDLGPVVNSVKNNAAVPVAEATKIAGSLKTLYSIFGK